MSVAYTRTFYNLTSIIYDPVINWAYNAGREILKDRLTQLKHGTLLEIGAGTGANVPYIPNKFNYTGIDLSKGMIAKARRKYKDKPFQFEVMNGESVAFEDHHFDAVIISHVLTVTENPGAIIKEAIRVLKPGGSIYIMNNFTRKKNTFLLPVKKLLALKYVKEPDWNSHALKVEFRTQYGQGDKLTFLHLQLQ